MGRKETPSDVVKLGKDVEVPRQEETGFRRRYGRFLDYNLRRTPKERKGGRGDVD